MKSTKILSKNYQSIFISFFFGILILLVACQVDLPSLSSTPTPTPGNMFEFTLSDGKKHIYQIFDTTMPWNEARKKAESLGGHLATITMQDEQDYIKTILGQNVATLSAYWLGGVQSAGSAEPLGNWQWVTGESFSAFTKWNSAQPDNTGSSEHYLEIRKSYGWEWNDIPLSGSPSGLICEWETPACLDKQSSGSHAYAFFDYSMTWSQAQDFAKQLGGYLVTVNSSGEESFLESILAKSVKSKYWLGGYQYERSIEPDEGWVWVNNEGFFGYRNWGANQPLTADDCLLIDKKAESIPRWYSSGRTTLPTDCGLIIEWGTP